MGATGIKFTSVFTSDLADSPLPYTRGEAALNSITDKGNPLIFRVEDALIDVTSGYFEAMKCVKEDKGLIYNVNPCNNLFRIQGKPCTEVRRMYADTVSGAPPVFYPSFIALNHLKILEYPVILLCDTRELVKFHPVFTVLLDGPSFKIISSDNLHMTDVEAYIVSPYKSDAPDYLFPRSFNRNDADSLYTLKLSY